MARFPDWLDAKTLRWVTDELDADLEVVKVEITTRRHQNPPGPTAVLEGARVTLRDLRARFRRAATWIEKKG